MSTPLGEMEGDLEFLVGLFDDLPESDGLGETSTVASPPAASAPRSPPTAASVRGDRRRRRSDNGQDGISSEVAWTSSGWKEIAKRQKQQRQDAEHENAKLRTIVDAHVQTTRQIVKLTQKAAMLASRRGIVSPTLDLGTLYLGPPSSDLARITRELDVLAREADNVMTPSTFGSTALQVLSMQNRIVSTATGTAIEATMEVAWVLPFGVDAITNTLLASSVRLVAKKDYRNATTLFESSQLKVVQAATRSKEKNGLLRSKHGWLATRCEPRQRSDGSSLLLMAARGGLVVDSKLVVAIEGDSCILVERVPGHDASSLGPLSRIQWYRRFRSQPAAAASLSAKDRARWIHSFMSRSASETDRQVDKVTQAMENLLLTSSLRVEDNERTQG